MRLGSLRTKARDGQLALVSADLRQALPVGEIAPTLRDALDRWAQERNIKEDQSPSARYVNPPFC